MTTFSAVQNKGVNSGDPASITLDSSPTTDNILIGIGTERSGTGHGPHAVSDTEGGWTKILGHDQELGETQARHSASVWWKKVTGSTPTLSNFDDGTGNAKSWFVVEYTPNVAYDFTFAEKSSADSGTGSTSPLDSGSTADPGSSDLFVVGFGAWRNAPSSHPTSPALTNLGGGVQDNIGTDGNSRDTVQDFNASGQSSGAKSTSVSWGGTGHEAIAAIAVFRPLIPPITLDEYQSLSEPVLPLPVQHPDAFVSGPLHLESSAIVTYARMEFPEVHAPTVEIVTLDEYQALSVPVLPLPLQHPDAFTTDPETLDASLRDEIQWFQPFSEPVLPVPLTRVGWYAIDPTTLDAPLRDELQWFVPLSEPVLPKHLFQRAEASVIDPESLAEGLRDELQWSQPFSEPVRPIIVQQPEAAIIDPTALDDPLRDEIQWWQNLSVPVLPEHQTRLGWFTTDSETLGDPLGDRLEWFAEFSVPVLPEEQTRLGWSVIDTETLAEELRDEIQWFQEFSLPTLPRHQVRPGTFVIDPGTLAEGLRDELQWFQGLSEPVRSVAEVIEAGNIFVDEPPAVVADDDELEWFQAFLVPERLPPWRYSEAFAVDPETLNEPLRDELQWFRMFSTPLPRKHQDHAGWIDIDPETISVAIVGPPKHEGFTRNVGRLLK